MGSQNIELQSRGPGSVAPGWGKGGGENKIARPRAQNKILHPASLREGLKKKLRQNIWQETIVK